MSDFIHILPDSVANQIAAGEVIQRPASVVKELIENSIDSGATDIKINIKDSGKTLIQVIDNGSGMSETDARLAFERHATSKITKADDLFCIKTLGFRGEALASIAAIASVELKTRKQGAEVGTSINISGSEFISQEPSACNEGSNFSIKNLFFNVPARRKFLKSDSSEFHHIIDEFHRVALARPEIAFSLIHNNSETYVLPVSNPRQRIINIFGKNLNQQLIPINTETSLVNIFGFIAKPEFAKKTAGQQFFFVNNRFMKHPYFNRAVLNSCENIIKPNEYIPYFIYFSVLPGSLDVNIHPTKTEIKFEDEQMIWQILRSSLKESLGKFNIVPSIDFDIDRSVNIPVLKSSTEIKEPGIKIDPNYNPFSQENEKTFSQNSRPTQREQDNLKNWAELYNGFESGAKNKMPESMEITPPVLIEKKPDDSISYDNTKFFQLKSKYIVTVVKSGLMIIDQKRAHERILYENYINSLKHNSVASQTILYPIVLSLNQSESQVFREAIKYLNKLGFIIKEVKDNSFEISGIPESINESEIQSVIDETINNYELGTIDVESEILEKTAALLARASSINYGKSLAQEETRNLIDCLFACKSPATTPSGRKIFTMINYTEIEKIFES